MQSIWSRPKVLLSYSELTLYQNDKFLHWSKFKAFADDKLNLAEELKFALGRVENIVGKGENAGFQHFLTIFSKGFYLRVVKSWDCMVKS